MLVTETGRRLAASSGVSLVCFAAYWITHGTGPFWQDAGLFYAALKAGGGLAPPGYPVYMILGRPFVLAWSTLLPARSFAEAVNVFSSIWAALAAGITTLSILLLLAPGYRFFASIGSNEKRSRRDEEDAEPTLGSAAWIAGIVGGLLSGLSYSPWFQAITAEAYALNAFFSAWIIYLFLRLGGEGPLGLSPTKRQSALLVLLFVVHGLSCGNHPVTVIFVPALAVLAWTQRAAFHDRRLVATVFVAYGASGLLPYLYLPWAANKYPQTLFSHITTPAAVLGHVSGSQWTTHSRSYGWEPARLAEFPVQLWHELWLVGLIALALGLAWIASRTPSLFRSLPVFAVPAWLLPIVYLQGGEYDFWLLPFYMGAFVVAGAGLYVCAEWLTKRARRPAFAFAILLVAALAPAIKVNFPLLDRRGDFVAEDFARNLYRHLAPDSILFASSDQECALSLYLQVVEGVRPDVIRIDAPTLELPWYAAYLERRYPELTVPSLPRTADPGPTWSDLVAAIIAANRDRTVYISKRPDRPMPAGRAWVPAGGLWKLVPAQMPAVDLGDWNYLYRNENPFDRPARDHAPQKTVDELGNQSVSREPYTNQIRRFHMQGWKNLGDWHVQQGAYQGGLEAYQRVFELEPSIDHPGLSFSMGKALFAVGREDEALPYLEKSTLSLAPVTRAEALLYAGQIHAGLGRMDRAHECFELVGQLAPEMWRANAPALFAKGYIVEQQPGKAMTPDLDETSRGTMPGRPRLP